MESGQGRIVSDIYGTDARNMFAHPLRSTGQERRSQRGGDGNETLRRYRTETVIRCAIQANHERRTIVSSNGLKHDIGPHIDEAEAAAVIHGDTKFRRQFVKCGIAGQPASSSATIGRMSRTASESSPARGLAITLRTASPLGSLSSRPATAAHPADRAGFPRLRRATEDWRGR